MRRRGQGTAGNSYGGVLSMLADAGQSHSGHGFYRNEGDGVAVDVLRRPRLRVV